MKYNPDIHHRKSIRLNDFDYSSKGAYFFTLCIHERLNLFGNFENDRLILNSAGLKMMDWYKKLEIKFPRIQCDEFICMPNHVHFIVFITNPVGADPRVRPGQAHGSAPTNIGTLIQWFKTMTTNEYIKGIKCNQWTPFNGKLWQRNYWERVVRDDQELNEIRNYIINNPLNWKNDSLFIP